ncbi:MAG: amidohydrolase family protein [Vampirovibrionales bacterium]
MLSLDENTPMGSPTAIPVTTSSAGGAVSAHWVLPVSGRLVQNATLQWNAAGVISALGPSEETTQGALCSLAGTTLLTPGLINTHTHLELTHPEAIPLGSGNFGDWLLSVAELTRQPYWSHSMAHANRLQNAAQQLWQSGVTTVNDIARHPETFSILQQLGVRGVISYEWFHPSWQTLSTEAVLTEYTHWWHQRDTQSRLHIGLSPHSFYNVSPGALRSVLTHCAKTATPPWLIHTHVGECEAEKAWLTGDPNVFDQLHQTLLGKTYTPEPLPKQSGYLYSNWLAYIQAHELFNLASRWIWAHGVGLSPSEWEQLMDLPKQQNVHVRVSHCPSSNLFLHGKTLPGDRVAWAYEHGLVSLGTDSSLSGAVPYKALDVRAEARYVAQQSRLSGEALLQMVTQQAASHLGLESLVGQLSPGWQADWVLWSVPPHVPCQTPQQAYNAWLNPDVVPLAVAVQGAICYTQLAQGC